jgi:hypothetical protein
MFVAASISGSSRVYATIVHSYEAGAVADASSPINTRVFSINLEKI